MILGNKSFQEPTKKRSIAYIISPHGFGHAARASAVMSAVHELDSTVRFEIFTTIPLFFFEESLTGPFKCHSFVTDIGFVQKSAFEEDMKETVRKLDSFLPFSPLLIENLSTKLKNLECLLVICDIAAIGILAAKKANIPSMLVENFTWDWIYEGYTDSIPKIQRHISYLKNIFKEADFHIQADPVCKQCTPDITVLPVSRKARRRKTDTRKELGIPSSMNVVLVSSGGVPEEYHFYEKLKKRKDIFFIIAGVGTSIRKEGNIICLPHHSGVYHPDLVNAVDAVVGKAGYSTLAEIYHAGIPFGYISRPDFREADVLSKFVESRMTGFEIGEEEFRTGDWVYRIRDLLKEGDKRNLSEKRAENGANQIAAFIKKQLNTL
jgi:hypothetical protein